MERIISSSGNSRQSLQHKSRGSRRYWLTLRGQRFSARSDQPAKRHGSGVDIYTDIRYIMSDLCLSCEKIMAKHDTATNDMIRCGSMHEDDSGK